MAAFFVRRPVVRRDVREAASAEPTNRGVMSEVLDAQAEAALDVLRAAVIRLLRDGGVSPRLVALAMVRVAGELGASVAVADGLALERVLGELADFTRRAGREHHEIVWPKAA